MRGFAPRTNNNKSNKKMKKNYQNPEMETLLIETQGFLAASIGEEGGESTGTTVTDDGELDDLLG